MKPSQAITPDDLLDAMATADVLDTFVLLPESAQEEFRQWIGKARDEEAHWRRIDTLVMALRSAPRLGTGKAEGSLLSTQDQ